MAKKDYVNRRPTSATKRKKRGSKTRTKKATSNRLWVLISILLIVIVAITVWIKFFHSTSHKTEVIPAKAQHSKIELPSRPEVEWSYIKQLETREVPVNNSGETQNPPLTKEQQKILQQLAREGGGAFQAEKKSVLSDTRQATSRYALQCGAFKNKEQAESLQAQLAFNGLYSTVKNSANWYRVFISNFDSRTEAQATQAKIKSLVNCVIITM